MRLDSGRILALAASLLAIGTLLGAFGTHALRGALPPDRLDFYTTGVRYQFLHALGLLGVGVAARTIDSAALRWAAGLLFAGIALFCGSLYGMTFQAPRALAALTAVGGVTLVVAWALFAFAAWRSRQS
jgi:uncharacterized membrane protein YgdD (TMEM256/DUF423 family)